MGEAHAYGYSCFCLSRRLFILGFCVVMSVLCLFKLSGWAYDSNLFSSMTGAEQPPARSCNGPQCYEIFSCYGFKDATQHFREPLGPLSGIIFFPIGAMGALQGSRWCVEIASKYIWLLFVAQVFMLIADVFFTVQCDMYPTNLMDLTLSSRISGLTFLNPISPAVQMTLSEMKSYPVDEVQKVIPGGFPALKWYIGAAGFWVLLLGYVSYEADWLARLVERGPLGLGMHFGVGQWDEVLNHDTIRIMRQKQMKSKFLEDATLPLTVDPHLVGGWGYRTMPPAEFLPPPGYYGAPDVVKNFPPAPEPLDVYAAPAAVELDPIPDIGPWQFEPAPYQEPQPMISKSWTGPPRDPGLKELGTDTPSLMWASA